MIDFIRFSRVLNCQLQSTRWSRFFGSVDQGYVSMVAKRLLLWIFRSGRLRAVWILSSSPHFVSMYFVVLAHVQIVLSSLLGSAHSKSKFL